MMNDEQLAMLYFLSYEDYHLNLCQERLELTSLAMYAHELAKRANRIYTQWQIRGGEPQVEAFVAEYVDVLRRTMHVLAMTPLDKV